jgi:hypothetical protein
MDDLVFERGCCYDAIPDLLGLGFSVPRVDEDGTVKVATLLSERLGDRGGS